MSAIFSESYVRLQPLMADEVTVRIENENCCGKLSYPVAISKLEILRGVGIWSFIDTDNRIQLLKMKYPNYYSEKNAIVGVSDGGFAISFQLNQNGRISIISLTKDYKAMLR